MLFEYRKIPIISPGLIFVQKAFCWAYFRGSLFSEGLIIGRNSAFQSLKHFENSSKQLAPTVHGLIFRRAYYRKDIYVSDLGGLFSGGLIFGGLIIGILRCFIQVESIIGSFLQWNLDRFNEPLYNEVLAIGI